MYMGHSGMDAAPSDQLLTDLVLLPGSARWKFELLPIKVFEQLARSSIAITGLALLVSAVVDFSRRLR